jgi:hypothetical protein
VVADVAGTFRRTEAWSPPQASRGNEARLRSRVRDIEVSGEIEA